jgi:hypothetical protein
VPKGGGAGENGGATTQGQYIMREEFTVYDRRHRCCTVDKAEFEPLDFSSLSDVHRHEARRSAHTV